VDGRLLKDLIAEGPLPAQEAVRIISQVLTALEYSHRAGVVHRDIKPGNIMIAANGQVKVMDFGIARAVSESSATIAETSAIVGTAQYFSPEQARGESVDARTDLYATGVVLFEMLTGRPPFRGENPVAVAYQHVNQVPVAPSSINPAVSPVLDHVVAHALAKDRFARYQSATEFREEVEAAGAGVAPVTHKTVAPNDYNSTLFGVNPTMTAGSDAALRQLTIDQESRASRTQQRPPVAWIWAGIALVVVIVVAVVLWITLLPKDPTGIDSGLSVVVPDVKGQSYDQAAAVLKKKNLIPQETTVTNAKVEAGKVISTSPPAGERVAPQQVVVVSVSIGPASFSIPPLSGLSVAEATTQLKQLGLTLGTVTAQDSATVPKGAIISSDPASGSPGHVGDKVNLVTSTGRINIPVVVGLSSSDAATKLNALHINYGVNGDSTCPSSKGVSAQSARGEQPQGISLTITVCTGN
jgi:serine/threonine-protein kinase